MPHKKNIEHKIEHKEENGVKYFRYTGDEDWQIEGDK